MKKNPKSPSALWEGLTKKPERQVAYDRIADEVIQSVKFPLQCNLLDVACGTGEIIVRLHGKLGSVAGTDIDPEMLARARDNLRAHNITAQLFTNQTPNFSYRKNTERGRVALILDNCLSTKLPAHSFDIAVRLFGGFSRSSILEHEKMLGNESPKTIPDMIQAFVRAEQKSDRQVSKLLKEGGTYLKTIYYRRHRSRLAIETAKRVQTMRLRSLRHQFSIMKNEVVPSDSIGKDAFLISDAGYWASHYVEGDFGYRILTLKKK